MKLHLALLALLAAVTNCIGSSGTTSHQQPSHLSLFFIDSNAHQSEQEGISVKSPRSPVERYSAKNEYKNIYESYKTQASKGVYFKPIEEYFGLKHKTTAEPLIQTSTAKPIEEKYTTPIGNPTSTPLFYSPSHSPDIFTTVKTPSVSSTLKHAVPFYLKPKNATLKMDEPLFYSDYRNQSSLNLSSNYHGTTYPLRLETTTIKHGANSVPVYYLSKPYYSKETSTSSPFTKVETTTKASASYTETDSNVEVQSAENNAVNKQIFPTPSPLKKDKATPTKVIDSTHTPKRYPPATTTEPSIIQKEAYQTTTRAYISSSYAAASTPIKATHTTEAHKSRPFKYSYAVKDKPSYNDYSHQQESDGNVVTGSYRVHLPDGRIQIVTYRADKNGYNADVRYETASERSPTFKS